MSWSDIITIILGSSILSVILNYFFQNMIEKYRILTEEQRYLYGELGLYIALAKITHQTHLETIADLKKQRDFVIEVINEQIGEYNKLFVPQFWELLDKIKNLLEIKAGYIRKKDYTAVAVYFRSYYQRLAIGKDRAEKPSFLSEEKYDEYEKSIFKALDMLSESLNSDEQSNKFYKIRRWTAVVLVACGAIVLLISASLHSYFFPIKDYLIIFSVGIVGSAFRAIFLGKDIKVNKTIEDILLAYFFIYPVVIFATSFLILSIFTQKNFLAEWIFYSTALPASFFTGTMGLAIVDRFRVNYST